jgi:hypothetical protein
MSLARGARTVAKRKDSCPPQEKTLVHQLYMSLCASYFSIPGPTCWTQLPCMYPPLGYKREGICVAKRGHTKLALEPIKGIGEGTISLKATQYNSQWSRVLRSGGPNHSKPLCTLAFFLAINQTPGRQPALMIRVVIWHAR